MERRRAAALPGPSESRRQLGETLIQSDSPRSGAAPSSRMVDAGKTFDVCRATTDTADWHHQITMIAGEQRYGGSIISVASGQMHQIDDWRATGCVYSDMQSAGACAGEMLTRSSGEIISSPRWRRSAGL